MEAWIAAQDPHTIYAILFALLLAGPFGLPVPEDIPLILGGVIANQGVVHLDTVFVICYSGIIIGDLIIYLIGRRYGPRLFAKPRLRQRFTPERVARLKRRLEKRGFMAIFIARHLPYLRTVTFLACGAVKMPLRKFFVADAAAALVSAPLMLALGFVFSEHYSALVGFINKFKIVSVGLAIGMVIVYFSFIRGHLPARLEDVTDGDADDNNSDPEISRSTINTYHSNGASTHASIESDSGSG